MNDSMGLASGVASGSSAHPRRRWSGTCFLLILIAYVFYACAFIYRTSFIIDGTRYFCLFDDEMISMRYAANLAHGHALVWNPGGERVEGFTNPLWVAYMALLHLLPVTQPKISALVQLTGMSLLILNLFVVRRIAEAVSGGSAVVALCATALTASYLPLNNWALQGTEVSILALVVSVSAWSAIRCTTGEERGAWWLYVILGISTLVRPDMVVPAVTVLGFVMVHEPAHRLRHVCAGFGFLLLCVAALTLFRLWYYDDLLPNTYYLKLTGFPFLFRLTRGAWVSIEFLVTMNPLLPLLALGTILARQDWRLRLLGGLCAAQLVYSVYVGGDAWERWGGSNRYVSIAMPLFFVLLSCALRDCASYVAEHLPRRWAKGEGALLIGFALLCALSLNLPVGEAGTAPFAESLLIERPLHVVDNEWNVRRGLLLKRVTDERAKVAVVWAGAAPYFMQRFAIDLLGKNDRTIAREKMRIPSQANPLTAFYPGHMKWDYEHSFGSLKPDLVSELVFLSPGEALSYLENDYRAVEAPIFLPPPNNRLAYGFWWIRRDSSYVHLAP